MWKVMIADDEPKIRRGLRSSIEKLRPDMKVVAEAEDGQVALSLVEEQKPDILLVDIRMPFLNGLELIERINEVHRDCIIIVVTGHDEFEYAQRALHLKVFEYVLKPVPRDVLAAVLGRAEAELAVARRQNKYVSWAREQLERNMPLLREQFFRDWVCGRLSHSEIQEQRAFLGVETGGTIAMAMVHVVERFLAAAPAEEKDRRLALFTVRTIVEESLKGFPPLWVFQDTRDNIVAIACSPGGPAWVEAIGDIENRAGDTLAHAMIIAHATIPAAERGIPDTYDALSAEIAGKGSHRTFVVLAQSYIDGHYGEAELSLEEVAAAAQVSPGYLSRLLKHETGFSFVDYLTRVRINKAVQIMNDPAVKVYEVAEAVGYQSQHYFSRAFKRVFGRSPVEYRRGGEEG
jgi:two-component system, response regulator YesN